MLAAVAQSALPRLHERGRIKPLCAALREAAARIADLLRPLVARERTVAHVTGCLDREWESAVKRHNRTGGPGAQYLTERSLRQESPARPHRDLPGDRCHRAAFNIVQAPPPVQPQIVEIHGGLIDIGDRGQVLRERVVRQQREPVRQPPLDLDKNALVGGIGGILRGAQRGAP